MKITQKINSKYINEICKILLAKGAKEIDDKTGDSRTFLLDTTVGKLIITIPGDNTYCFTIFSRFDDVAKAKQKFDCNPFSGKYNAHISYFPELTIEEHVGLALDKFSPLLGVM